MSEETDSSFAPVDESESGQKLLRLLERRLGLPESLLHRWLRTGQIRLNGRRCKPFDIVETGDEIRLPPFAGKLAATTHSDSDEMELPPLLATDGDLLVFNKPAGLLSQPDRSGAPSLSSLLEEKYADRPFPPAPAHRLDRETSGIILVGASFKTLQQLHFDFRAGKMQKEYLAWVSGTWPWQDCSLLRHYLEDNNGIHAYPAPDQGRKEALLLAKPLRTGKDASLLQILLLTGRKRQIRAQLSACGHPILGDWRYGQKEGDGLKLHAFRIALPDGRTFSCLPPWQGEFRVYEIPESIQKS